MASTYYIYIRMIYIYEKSSRLIALSFFLYYDFYVITSGTLCKESKASTA